MDRRGGAGAGAGVTTPRENLSAGVNSRLKLEACTVAGRQAVDACLRMAPNKIPLCFHVHAT